MMHGRSPDQFEFSASFFLCIVMPAKHPQRRLCDVLRPESRTAS